MYDDRIVLSVTEAAKACGYTPSYIRLNIREGNLIASRVNGKGDYRILIENLHAWLSGNAPQSGQPKKEHAAA